MRFIARLALPLFLLAGCSTADVSIAPGEQFVLGEYEDGRFRVTLTNKSDQVVRVEARDENGAVKQGLRLDGGGQATVFVDRGDRIVVQNASPEQVVVHAVLSESVEGMRYEPVDAQG